jgi:hypothetical protein
MASNNDSSSSGKIANSSIKPTNDDIVIHESTSSNTTTLSHLPSSTSLQNEKNEALSTPPDKKISRMRSPQSDRSLEPLKKRLLEPLKKRLAGVMATPPSFSTEHNTTAQMSRILSQVTAIPTSSTAPTTTSKIGIRELPQTSNSTLSPTNDNMAVAFSMSNDENLVSETQDTSTTYHPSQFQDTTTSPYSLATSLHHQLLTAPLLQTPGPSVMGRIAASTTNSSMSSLSASSSTWTPLRRTFSLSGNTPTPTFAKQQNDHRPPASMLKFSPLPVHQEVTAGSLTASPTTTTTTTTRTSESAGGIGGRKEFYGSTQYCRQPNDTIPSTAMGHLGSSSACSAWNAGGDYQQDVQAFLNDPDPESLGLVAWKHDVAIPTTGIEESAPSESSSSTIASPAETQTFRIVISKQRLSNAHAHINKSLALVSNKPLVTARRCKWKKQRRYFLPCHNGDAVARKIGASSCTAVASNKVQSAIPWNVIA